MRATPAGSTPASRGGTSVAIPVTDPRSAGTRHVVMNGQVTGRNRTVAGVGFEADGRRTLDSLALSRCECRRGVVHRERVPPGGPGLAPGRAQLLRGVAHERARSAPPRLAGVVHDSL